MYLVFLPKLYILFANIFLSFVKKRVVLKIHFKNDQYLYKHILPIVIKSKNLGTDNCEVFDNCSLDKPPNRTIFFILESLFTFISIFDIILLIPSYILDIE